MISLGDAGEQILHPFIELRLGRVPIGPRDLHGRIHSD